MPIAKVRLPDGRIGRFNVAEGTTPEQVVQFAQQQDIGAAQQPVEQPVEEKPSFPGAGFIEPAATLISGAIAEPVAGIAGLAKTITSGPEAGAETIEAVRKGLTFQPRTEAGQQVLGAVGGALEPVGRVLQEAETFLGDETFEATGSPALAAAATTIPTAIIEAMGLVSAKGLVKGAKRTKRMAQDRAIKRAIVDAAPDIDTLKTTSRAVYNELSESGVQVQPKAFSKLVNKTKADIQKAGFDVDLTPKTAGVIRRLERELGDAKNLNEIDTLRKVAQNAASSLDPADARLGSIIIDNIDTFLDEADPRTFIKGNLKASEVAPRYRIARELWGRARRSELINEAFERAKNQASGFENGIVTQFRSILNNKKKAKFFKPNELKAMQEVVRGTTPANIAKVIGRLGFQEGHATNILGGAIGATAGGLAFGTPGAVAVPVIGQVSRKLAQRLTRKGAEFADTVIRAGDNAEAIARAYLKNVPKAARSAEELSELLLRPDIALDNLLTSSDKVLKTAAEIARGRQILAAAGAAGAGELGVARDMANQEEQ